MTTTSPTLADEREITLALLTDPRFPTHENRIRYIRETLFPLFGPNWRQIRRHVQMNFNQHNRNNKVIHDYVHPSWEIRAKRLGKTALNEAQLRAVLHNLSRQYNKSVNVNSLFLKRRPPVRNNFLPANRRKFRPRNIQMYVQSGIIKER